MIKCVTYNTSICMFLGTTICQKILVAYKIRDKQINYKMLKLLKKIEIIVKCTFA